MVPRAISLILAAVCAVVALVLASAARDASHLHTAEIQGSHGNFIASMRAADQVKHQPSLSRARALRAYASLGIGDLPDADRWFRVAIQDSPNDWLLRRDWAHLLARMGRVRSAKTQIRRAGKLNPRLPEARVLARKLSD